MVVKKVLCLSLSCLFLFGNLGIIADASQSVIDEKSEKAVNYETNICALFYDGAWEYPNGGYEFEPDEPLGAFTEDLDTEELFTRYSEYKAAYDGIGLMDSPYTIEDIETLRLTKEEEFTLSDVDFEYYYSYKSDSVIQVAEVYWISGARSRAVVVWENGVVVYLEVR